MGEHEERLLGDPGGDDDPRSSESYPLQERSLVHFDSETTIRDDDGSLVWLRDLFDRDATDDETKLSDILVRGDGETRFLEACHPDRGRCKVSLDHYGSGSSWTYESSTAVLVRFKFSRYCAAAIVTPPFDVFLLGSVSDDVAERLTARPPADCWLKARLSAVWRW